MINKDPCFFYILALQSHPLYLNSAVWKQIFLFLLFYLYGSQAIFFLSIILTHFQPIICLGKMATNTDAEGSLSVSVYFSAGHSRRKENDKS